MLRSRGLKGQMLLAASLMLAAASAAVLLRTQSLMDQGYEKALNTSRNDLTFDAATRPAEIRVGDEGYWLTRAEVQSPAPFAKPMVVGDRITITGVDGRERKLEVIGVKAVGASANSTTASLLLVTCRVTEEGGQETAPVRFIIEGELPKKAPPATVSKAL